MTLGQDLPVRDALPALRSALAENPAAVLEAPTGAGKTTLVPLALKDEPWLAGRKILMLEPRRLAARAAAQRMAEMLGERVGETVGYRVRHDVKVGRSTRIEVLTEALLTRRLQNDPTLDGIGLVIFDEFHERNLDGDLGLALALEAQTINDGLRLLVMSATLDGARVAGLLSQAPVVRSQGRLFPVETIYVPGEFRDAGAAMAQIVPRVLRESEGGVLAFLPGEAEIRSAERRLREASLPANVTVVPLFGNLGLEAQTAAIAPAPPGERKVVLATAIAETSLTIPDVRVVIDSGLSRQPRFDSGTGMSRLITTRVSLASAEQRRGRAGRIAPGRCYRLWSEEAQRALAPYTPPEIASADLAPLALELAAWGNSDPAAYALLDQPGQAAYAQSLELLRELGALTADGAITAHGRAINELGMHPRLAHTILSVSDGDGRSTALALAALLSERDLIRTDRDRPDIDLRTRLHAFAGDRPEFGQQVDRGALARARENARSWGRQLDAARGEIDPDRAGAILARAYPDRVAQRRGPRGAFRLRSGRGAMVDTADALAGEDLLAIATVDQGADNARVFLAAPIARSEIEDAFADQIETRDEVVWDSRTSAVAARRVTWLGALVLEERRLDQPGPEAVRAAMLAGVREMGLGRLLWTDGARSLQARAGFLRALDGPESDIADLSDAALAAEMDDWLGPYLDGVTRAGQLGQVDLHAALTARLGWQHARRVDDEAPTHLAVPTGSRIELDYASGEPVLAVRLQEMFGATTTPTVARGRVPVTLHLLSPARRPVQVTRDLAGFWARSYLDVKKDLKGRYPKHRWPDDPLAAQPTTRAKRPGEQD